MDIHTFLMFEGRAEEAVNLYVSLFPNSHIVDVQRHGEEGPGKPGISTLYRFELNGVEYRALDSATHHAFTFTPAMSLFVDLDDEVQLDRVYARLAEGGAVLMPIGAYGFSRKFGWVNDRFGVSWQLNLP